MRKNRLKFNKIDKNIRNVKIPCINCGKLLDFSIKNDIVTSDSVIAINFPGAVCQDCINSALNRVQDPPGLICLKELNPTLAQEFINNFKFMVPFPEAVTFFGSLFKENQFIVHGKVE
jgi:hypothetical protein